jgi:uncharacterized protein YceH (UPF0502 family)
VEPDAAEIRVLGCLIEKQRTTPDAYPLTLNALRLACNQSTNRDPVVDYDESTIRGALERLGRRRWTTLASWSNRRAMKYRHALDSALGLSDPELAVLCVLMLRGPQTPGELKQRTERLHAFAGLEEVENTVRGLIERELAAGVPRRPGQREGRYAQLLGGADDDFEPDAGAATPASRRAAAGPATPEPAARSGPGARPEPAAPPEPAARPEPAAPEPAARPGPAPAAATATMPGAAPTAAPEPAAAEAAAPTAPAASAARLERRVARLEDDLASLRADLRSLREELGA